MKAQSTENKAKISLDTRYQQKISCITMKQNRKAKMLTKIAIVPTEEEMAIVLAGQKKHGLKSASEILRMALRRFAEAEKLELQAS